MDCRYISTRKQSWNVPIFSVCYISSIMDETQMHMYVRGWYVNKISSLSVGLIPIYTIVYVFSAGARTT